MGCDKNERATEHELKNQKVERPNDNLYLCSTENCKAIAATGRSIKRHLKNCKK